MTDRVVQFFVIPFVQVLVVLGAVSLGVAYLTLLERKILGFMQVRLAPRRVGFHGILQPIADGIKLLIKEDIIPDRADRFLFTLAPILTVIPAFTALAVIPISGRGTVPVVGYNVTPSVADAHLCIVVLLA